MFHCDCTCCCVGIFFAATLAIYKLLDHFWRRPRIGSFESRYIFITGCDTGYGNLVAKRLDALGCHVFAACLTEQGETELKKLCSNRLHTVPLDVTKHDSVFKAYEYVKKNSPAGKNQGFCHYYTLLKLFIILAEIALLDCVISLKLSFLTERLYGKTFEEFEILIAYNYIFMLYIQLLKQKRLPY